MQLKLLMYQEPDWGHFPEPARSISIADNPEDKEARNREFDQARLHLNCLDVSRYLGAFMEPREEMEEWMRPKVEAWAHGVRTLGQIAKRYPQLAYAELGMFIQLEWQYPQRTVPGVGS